MRLAPVGRKCALAVALWAACLVTARGGTGVVLPLPVGPAPAAGGLRLSVDTRWVQGYGYRPVRIDVTCSPPAVADRTLTVEFGLSSWDPSEEFITVAGEVEIPAGSSQVSHVLSVPQLDYAQHFSFRVWEDGVPIERLSVEGRSLNAGGYFNRGEAGPRILFITAGNIDVSNFATVGANMITNAPGGRVADVMSFHESPPAELPEGWINYSGLDVVFVSLANARDLAAARPNVWTALRRWTRAGGNLCVYGAGDDWHGLEEIENLLGCPATPAEAANQQRGWTPPSGLVYNNQVAGSAAQRPIDPRTGQPVPAPSKPPAAPQVAPFLRKAAGLGRVVAIAESQPFPGLASIWQWLFATLGPARTEWTLRQGTAPDEGNDQFNDFLIADVGLPPIRTYRVLITLFVVGIGPVNYWLLRRYGRLHLFLFTVPLAALVTSGALLGYALVSDGVASRLRARSLTQLDQRAGQAVRLARLSYYVGLAPSGGLNFPADTTITPLQLTVSDNAFGNQTRRIVWRHGQHLTRGWIRSRMPIQYVTTNAAPTKQRLDILSGGASGLTIRNKLEVPIKQLLVCDESGKFYHAAGMARDEQRTLAPLATEEAIAAAASEVTEALLLDRPGLPAAMIGATSTSSWFFPFAGRRRYGINQRAIVGTSESLLEVELNRIVTQLSSRSLKPKSYVAVVARPAEIAVGTDGLTESQSMHAIEGTW